MKWPSVGAILRFAKELKEIVTNSGGYVFPRCAIDGLEMKEIGSLIDGTKVYECPRGHTYSPGVDVGDRDRIIEQSKGDTHGEI